MSSTEPNVALPGRSAIDQAPVCMSIERGPLLTNRVQSEGRANAAPRPRGSAASGHTPLNSLYPAHPSRGAVIYFRVLFAG